jgi:hypothetical protein
LLSRLDDNGSAFVSDDSPVPVLRADCGVSTGKEPVQCRGEREMGILMHPGVFTAAARAIEAAGRLFGKEPEHTPSPYAQLMVNLA